MRTFTTLTLALLCAIASNAETYEPTWESLEGRETPQWFENAKFGIFIHWGLYSVPGYTNKGTYAEWYGHAKDANPAIMNERQLTRHKAVTAFHNRVYGKDYPYSNFRDGFTCELFDPAEWADIFKRSGARYVVLTSKHHDGYCLWPNKEASSSFGMDWNSVDSGPGRDLVGELTDAVRDEGLKMGLYYSIWDWFNPYWTQEQQMVMASGNMIDSGGKNNRKKADEKTKARAAAALDKYIHKVMYPQFKEIVMDYQPSLIFSDGDWWMDDDKWQTRPLLKWLYENAPNKDEVIINDRWGKVRGKYGNYFTTEYGSGFDGIDRPWEENRGIGMSFGVNRIENIDDYRTIRELIFMLVDLVSRGGNLLLNIGPNADGTIPVIMQERLIQIGNWLEVNGEAIYESRAWKKTAQWSEGNIPEFSKKDYHSGFPIFEMTINPKPGNAHKEMYFTHKGDTLYALLPVWPDSNRILIKDIQLGENSKVTMLGVDGELKSRKTPKGLVVTLPRLNPTKLPCDYIYTVRVTKVR